MSSVASSASLLSAKDAEIAELRAREASSTRIAVQAVGLLRALRADGRPAGIWVREEDRALFDSIQETELLTGEGGPWAYAELFEDPFALPNVTTLLTPHIKSFPRPVLTPFKSAFPLEILEHILSLTSPRTRAIFARASFACLQLLVPRLLARVQITGGSQGVESLFAVRGKQISARLGASLSLHHVQTLDVLASALLDLRASCVSKSRLKPGKSTLHLVKLLIRLDVDPVDDPANSDDDSDHEGGVCPQVDAYRPSLKVLGLLNPTKLQIKRYPGYGDDYKQYRITRAAATVIASWTRLRTIELVNVNLFVLFEVVLDTESICDHSLTSSDMLFFLGPDIVGPIGTKGSKEWALRWDVSDEATVDAFEEGGTKTFPEELVEGGALESKRVKSATIIVGDEELREKVAAEIGQVEMKKRGSLTVEVKDQK